MTPEIIAHRGASADAPENTLAAVQLAWQLGADAAEIDVLLTSDGQLVAIHDETTLRTSGVDWDVATRSLAELKTLDVGSWKSPRFVGERIPTLAEVLDIVPSGKRLFIEAKCGPEAIPELKRTLANASTSREQTVLISLDLDTIVAVKQALPDRVAFWVTEQFARGASRPSPLEPPTSALIEQASAAGLDGLDINDMPERPRGDIALIRHAGLRTCIWTVNSAERALWLRDEGMQSITTDVPAKLLVAFSQPQAE
ncbi:MAG TPA: glycerophosphodiester phosphodiesterase [Planctomycetaceae bacterium]|nr:glycerophosphodiester phosphodiesterase [Planctomycetaceae bacterium]